MPFRLYCSTFGEIDRVKTNNKRAWLHVLNATASTTRRWPCPLQQCCGNNVWNMFTLHLLRTKTFVIYLLATLHNTWSSRTYKDCLRDWYQKHSISTSWNPFRYTFHTLTIINKIMTSLAVVLSGNECLQLQIEYIVFWTTSHVLMLFAMIDIIDGRIYHRCNVWFVCIYC